MNGRKLIVLTAITAILALGEFASAVMIGLGEDGPDRAGWPFAVAFGVFFAVAAWLLRSGALFGLVVCPGFPQAGMSGRECHGAVADDRGMAGDDDLGDPAVLFVRGALQGAGAPHGYALVDLNTVGAVRFR